MEIGFEPGLIRPYHFSVLEFLVDTNQPTDLSRLSEARKQLEKSD